MRYVATGRARAPSGGVTKQAMGSGCVFCSPNPLACFVGATWVVVSSFGDIRKLSSESFRQGKFWLLRVACCVDVVADVEVRGLGMRQDEERRVWALVGEARAPSPPSSPPAKPGEREQSSQARNTEVRSSQLPLPWLRRGRGWG